MPEEKLDQFDVAAIFHGILFAYQKTVMNFLGETPSSVITAQTIPVIEEIIERASPSLTNVEKAEEALRRLVDLLRASGFVGEARIEMKDGKCILDIDGCIFADHMHSMLKTKDVTCPWAIFAMSVIQKTTKRRVKISLSEFSTLGSRTHIEPMSAEEDLF